MGIRTTLMIGVILRYSFGVRTDVSIEYINSDNMLISVS